MVVIQSAPVNSTVNKRQVGRPYQSLVLMLIITCLMFGVIGGRLAHLQLTEGAHNRQLADNNRTRIIPKPPQRGNIFDRHGKLLVGSRLSHSLYVWPRAPKQAEWPTTLQHLSEILNIPATEIEMRLKQAGYNSPTLVRIARGLSPGQLTALAEFNNELNGVDVGIEAVREYPNGDVAAHVVGYTGEISDAELAKRDFGYRLGDVSGQMGAEAAFEKQLRGEWGGQQFEVNGAGRIIRLLGEKPAKAGQDLHLTLDLDLQKTAEAALGDRKGAIVALDPRNGAILAMASRPAFDPNIFSTRIDPNKWKELQSKDHPFVNRAIRGFPPASTFKVITTTAGIQSGKYSPDTVLDTYASLNIGGVNFADWNHAGFGPLGFVGALTWSSDTFFYQIGRGVGGPTLIDWARRYGFGKKTGSELVAEESRGLVADDAWKRKHLHLPWSVGDTVNMSIGQGFLQVTPLQLAVMFSVPANGGYLVRPHLLKDNEDKKNWRRSLNLKPETIRVLHEGLRGVVNGGTGNALNVPTIPPAAGKSGTAESFGHESHVWFCSYAPSDRPEIVVVAFGENAGGSGGKVAAPMVLQVLETYFKGRNG